VQGFRACEKISVVQVFRAGEKSVVGLLRNASAFRE